MNNQRGKCLLDHLLIQ